MPPKVFIIILNWNKWHLTEDCLKSLRGLNYENYQLVVVDNNSKPEEKELIFNSPLRPFFVLIENNQNLGFAGGNNTGIKYALRHGADYVLLLNNDTIIEDKSFLKKMVEIAEGDKKIGIIGPKIYYYEQDVSRQSSGQIFAPRAKIWFGGGKLNWLKTRAWHLQDEEQGETDFITGCCLLIKREVIEKTCPGSSRGIGLMSEEFFLYFEDADWCLRVQKAGYKCVYVPLVWIWHKVAASSIEFSYNYIYYNTRNGLLLGWRHGNFFKRLIIFFLGFWIIFKQIIKIFFNYKKEWSSAMLLGVWDFWRGKFGQKE